jgi:peptide/nickel transport system permease protein
MPRSIPAYGSPGNASNAAPAGVASGTLRTLRRRARRDRLWSTASLLTGALLATLVIGAGLLSPLIAPYSPTELDLVNPLASPSSAHLMGTDELGRDVFSRTLYAVRLDIGVIIAMTAVSLLLGVAVGSLAGYFRGVPDFLLGRTIDVVLAFPFLVLVIGVIAITGPGVLGVFIGMTIVGWAVYARLTRAEMLSVREREFIAAAQALGYSKPRIIARHALPNVVTPALVFSMSDLVLNLMTLAALSYLGLGVQPPTPELGAIIADGQEYLFTAWWISTLPGVVLVMLGVSFSLIGDALAERLGQTDALPL